MKSILIPTDFSPKSGAALKAALDLAKFSGAELTLLHTVKAPIAAGSFVDELVDGRKSTAGGENNTPTSGFYFSYESEELDRWLKKELEELGRPEVHSEFLQVAMVADVSDGIARAAKKVGSDLIVIGTGKEGRMEQITSSLTGLVDCYLLSIPEHWKWGKLKNITIASDFQEDETAALWPILNLVRLYGARIHLIHLKHRNDFERIHMVNFNKLIDVLHEEEGFIYKQLTTSDYEKAIYHSVMEERTDLLVMRCRNCEKPDGLIDKLTAKLSVPIFILPKASKK